MNQLTRLDGQRGVVLFIALIVLVAMTLAAVALIRSVDTTTLIAGNLTFQQAAVLSADQGVEDAITWLEANNDGASLNADDATRGYFANGNARNPASGQSWDEYWVSTLAANAYSLFAGDPDTAGNRISYVIDRLCNAAGAPNSGAGCTESPVVSSSAGNQEEGGEVQLNSASVIYYRITVRVAGPKNTVSYVQSVVSM